MGSRIRNTTNWRAGVRVVRAQALGKAMLGTGRATAFDFTGIGGKETSIGTVTMPPKAVTGAHHHGRHEVAIYVVKGRGSTSPRKSGPAISSISRLSCRIRN